jgi:hypothetical protein
MTSKRLFDVAFWAVALAMVAGFAYDTVTGAFHLGGFQLAVWAVGFLAMLAVGACLSVSRRK